MELLRQAVQAAQRNVNALLVYLGAAFVVAAALQGAGHAMGNPENPFADPRIIGLSLGLDFLVVVISALIQAVIFARFGQEIDRPLWKIDGDWQAILRFAPVWFVLNLLIVACNYGAGYFLKVLNDESTAGFLLLLTLFVLVVYIPIGAAWMFVNGGGFSAGREGMKILLRRFPQMLPILLFNFAVVLFALYLDAQTAAAAWLRPLVTVAEAYFDCVIFSAVWLVCIYDRQNPEENELDF